MKALEAKISVYLQHIYKLWCVEKKAFSLEMW